MARSTTIAAFLLAVSGSAAMAQTAWMPPGPNEAPGGASGPASVRDVGTTPNVLATPDARTSSSSMVKQSIKAQSAAGASSTTYPPYPASTRWQYSGVPSGTRQAVMSPPRSASRQTFIVDEYGRHYNYRGDRIR